MIYSFMPSILFSLIFINSVITLGRKDFCNLFLSLNNLNSLCLVKETILTTSLKHAEKKFLIFSSEILHIDCLSFVRSLIAASENQKSILVNLGGEIFFIFLYKSKTCLRLFVRV